MGSIDEQLAAEELSDWTEEEIKVRDDVLSSVTEAQRQKLLKDSCGTLTLIRAYQKEVPRIEKTRQNIQIIVTWRDLVDVSVLLDSRLERDEEFHSKWPENLYGMDKYGHMIYGMRMGDIDRDGLLEFSDDELQRLQGQKLEARKALKVEHFARTGIRRYKHTAIIDVSAVSMSMLAGQKTALLKRISQIGGQNYPETVWKIYLVNAPMVFRAVWTVVRQLLHPVTVAKVSILGSSAAATMEQEGVIPEQEGVRASEEGNMPNLC
jgi:hypothetical protein